jgi:FAD/FMN-containing dehydrogenase/Fe-S oxidoreductase
MDPDRARILADLNGAIDGNIYCDDLTIQMYSTDASIHELKPLAVISPASTRDVVKIVNYCRENQIPVHPRGSGSNTIGGCLGKGVVLDFSESMRRLVSVDREAVTVQAGAVLANINRELKVHGRFISPDPATRSITTIGGMLSLNLSGSHWVKYGTPRDKVLSLQVVLASGDVVNLDSAANLSRVNQGDSVVEHLEQRTQSILRSREKELAAYRPKTELNEAGYDLWSLQRNDQIDLTRLMVGSEGTLGIITKATISTDPIPKHRGVALLFFERLDFAAKAAIEIGGMGIVACDLLDRRLLTLARETDDKYVKLIPAEAEAMLLVEFQAEEDAALRDRFEFLAQRIIRRRRLAFEIRTATQPEERNLFWRLTRRVTPTLYRLRGNRRAVPFIEAIAVPPAKLPDFLAVLHQVLNRYEVTASVFAHTPQGILQVHPFIDLSSPPQVAQLQPLAEELLEKVTEFGGTLSGMFGDGFSRTWTLRKHFGNAYSAFVEIKSLFDPTHMLNPGKIVDQPACGLTDQLRKVTLAETLQPPPETSVETVQDEEAAKTTPLPVLVPQLNWSLAEMNVAARNCNGCGRCRTSNIDQRMCPIFRAGPKENASPRAKANLMRAILTGQLPKDTIGSDEFREVSDLCVNCHQCRLECPASVDIPKLMVEAKAHHVEVNGLGFNDWVLSRLDLLYALASKAPRLTNYLIQNRTARWLLDRLLGIAQGRKLPRFSQSSFLTWAGRQKLNRVPRQNGHKVVFFVDAFVNWNDLELGQALVKILQHNNIDVVVPLEQAVSGMSLISDGVLGRARKLAARNVELLADYIRQGFHVVTAEPSAALALKHEYLNLLSDPDAKLVSDNTFDVCQYLWQLHQTGDLQLNFRPLNVTVGYHQPCHQRALQIGQPGVELMRLIPGVQVDCLNLGCSGMAGVWGVKQKNYLRSLRIGFPLINALRSPDLIIGTTECATCKMQMEQGTSKLTAHPIKILAMAYGLMPQLTNLFSRRSEELLLS